RRGRPIGQGQLLLVVVVKCGGLLGEQIDGRFLEIEIRRNEANFLQRDLFGAHLLRLDGFFDPVFEKLVDFVLGDQVVADGLLSLHSGTGRYVLKAAVDLAKNLAAILRGAGRQQANGGEGAERAMPTGRRTSLISETMGTRKAET